MTTLRPLNNHILVRLGDYYKYVQVKEDKYSTRTSGFVLHVEADSEHIWALETIGKKVYFSEYKEGVRVEKDGELLAFVKIDDIEGYEEEENVETGQESSSRKRSTNKD